MGDYMITGWSFMDETLNEATACSMHLYSLIIWGPPDDSVIAVIAGRR